MREQDGSTRRFLPHFEGSGPKRRAREASERLRLTRRTFQEAVISLAIMLLLIGFLLQFLIYTEMGMWLDAHARLGQLLAVALAVAMALSILLLYRWRSMRRELAERARLDEQLQLLKEAVETMEIGITITDRAGRIRYANQAEAALHGYEVDELIGQEARILAPRALWREMSLDELKELRRSRRESVNVDKSGNLIPVQLISNVVLDDGGEPIGLVTACEDIGERKRAEEELRESRRRLRALAQHLEGVRDRERARIAHEIHNDVGGALTVLKINLAMLEEALARESSDHIERVHRMLENIDGMVDIVRSISRRLRPFLLDDVGLVAAIEWHAEDVARRTGIRCQLSLPDDEPRLPEEQKETLFRVFQEAITNSLRHARPRKIWAELAERGEAFELTVGDDGVGITDLELNDPSTFGLFALRERVDRARGELAIEGRPGLGTRVSVTLPTSATEEGDDQGTGR